MNSAALLLHPVFPEIPDSAIFDAAAFLTPPVSPAKPAAFDPAAWREQLRRRVAAQWWHNAELQFRNLENLACWRRKSALCEGAGRTLFFPLEFSRGRRRGRRLQPVDSEGGGL